MEKLCLQWGTDLIDEVFESKDDIQILRMLICMKDNFPSLVDRAVPGMAPWRTKSSTLKTEDDENGQGPVYQGELVTMLDTLVKYNENEEVVKAAKSLMERFAESFS